MSERPDMVEVSELRLTVEDQARYIDALLARLEHLAGEEVALRDLAATLREQVGRADADLRRLEAELTQARAEVARLEGRVAALAAVAHAPAVSQPAPGPEQRGVGWAGRLAQAGWHVRRGVARRLPWLASLYRRLVAYRVGRQG